MSMHREEPGRWIRPFLIGVLVGNAMMLLAVWEKRHEYSARVRKAEDNERYMTQLARDLAALGRNPDGKQQPRVEESLQALEAHADAEERQWWWGFLLGATAGVLVLLVVGGSAWLAWMRRVRARAAAALRGVQAAPQAEVERLLEGWNAQENQGLSTGGP